MTRAALMVVCAVAFLAGLALARARHDLAGAPHRAAAACSATRPMHPPDPAAPGCKSDVECKGRNARCVLVLGRDRRNQCVADACDSDADCGKRAACACGQDQPPRNLCVAANCRSDKDCGKFGVCSPVVIDAPCTHSLLVTGFFCHTRKDACAVDTDCSAGVMGGRCQYVRKLGRWACVPSAGMACPVG